MIAGEIVEIEKLMELEKRIIKLEFFMNHFYDSRHKCLMGLFIDNFWEDNKQIYICYKEDCEICKDKRGNNDRQT